MGELTVYQLSVYCSRKGETPGAKRIKAESIEQAQSIARSRKKAKSRIINLVLERIRSRDQRQSKDTSET